MELLARAKTAPYRGLDKPNVVFINSQNFGDDSALLKDSLRVAVYGQAFSVAVIADAAGWLNGNMLHRRRGKMAGEHGFAFFFGTSLTDAPVLYNIVAGQVRLNCLRSVRHSRF
ncbi:hypothetical protein SDC9_92785 [bioreactor metagenome]|uniref:Uncharacterized protein n=1 Tax=bioreactor metagenome TaxID=1076179 RepID=A0A644ZYQ3_9ZZZZ